MLERGQVAEFAERGFLLLPQVVSPDVVAAASAAIDDLIERNPPGPGVRGPHNYNLWVCPCTHVTHGEYFREHGADAFLAAGGYPPVKLPEPEQITGRAGDLLLAHYLLGHNIGGNTSPAIRRAVYFRIKRSGHDARWREFLSDPWLDYDTVRERGEGEGNGGE